MSFWVDFKFCSYHVDSLQKKKKAGGQGRRNAISVSTSKYTPCFKKKLNKIKYDAIDLLHIEVQQNTIIHFCFGGQLLSCMLVENLSKIHILQET